MGTVGNVHIREARGGDLYAVVTLLGDDPLGREREDDLTANPAPYRAAFAAISQDDRNFLLVAECAGVVCGCLQLTFIPGLTHTGGERAQIEGVRVARRHRGSGIGRALVEHAIARARKRGCVLVQLTSDKTRPEAIAFYQKAGFQASHIGLKLRLG